MNLMLKSLLSAFSRSFLFFTVTFAITNLSVTAFAETDDCIPFDLRKPGFPLHQVPPLSQGNENLNYLCGFFTTSALMDSLLRKSPELRTISRIDPLSFAIEIAVKRDLARWVFPRHSSDPFSLKYGRWGSSTCDLLDQIKTDTTVCLNPSKDDPFGEKTGEFADFLTRFHDKIESNLGISFPGYAPQFTESGLNDLYGIYSKEAGMFTKTLDAEKFHAVLKRHHDRPYRILKELFFSSCPAGSVTLSASKVGGQCRSELLLWEKNSFSEKVSAAIKKNPLTPIPFAYCYSVFKSGEKYVRHFPWESACQLHWSLIVGQKKVSDRCYLLIRNSKQPTTTSIVDGELDQGDVWVNRATLGRATFLLQPIE
jgi:hypothetical protein